ncbi:hypothetical protein DFJ74DRAFT_312953 [Hyaloraphidium curvatum]|nr:hypothetical protein DFJ74DRAFT_312953 [Hyaloraphidium curvatum]
MPLDPTKNSFGMDDLMVAVMFGVSTPGMGHRQLYGKERPADKPRIIVPGIPNMKGEPKENKLPTHTNRFPPNKELQDLRGPVLKVTTVVPTKASDRPTWNLARIMFNARQEQIWDKKGPKAVANLVKELRMYLAARGDPTCAIEVPKHKNVEGIHGWFPPAIYTAMLVGDVKIARMLLDEAKVPTHPTKVRPDDFSPLPRLIVRSEQLWPTMYSNQPYSLLAAALLGAQTLGNKKSGSAAGSGGTDAIEFCLSIGCDPNGPTRNPTIGMPEDGAVPDLANFFGASVGGMKEVIEGIVKGNVSRAIDRDDPRHMFVRPLHVLASMIGPGALRYEHALRIGRVLVAAGADPNLESGLGLTPLSYAIEQWGFECRLRWVNPRNWADAPPRDAALEVRMILELGADAELPNASPRPMSRPVDMIAGSFAGSPLECEKVAAELLKAGLGTFADVPHRMIGPDGMLEYDYLRVSIEMGNVALVRFAIEKAGLDPDSAVAGGGFPTVLGYATKEGYIPMIKMLLELGADPLKKSGDGSASALDAARIRLDECRRNKIKAPHVSDAQAVMERANGQRPPPTLAQREEIVRLLEAAGRKRGSGGSSA